MRDKTLAVCVLAGAMLACSTLRPDHATAGEVAEAKAKPVPANVLTGFKGFLVGEMVATNDKGIVLFVQAVTLVEGNAAPGPGPLIGKDTPVQFVLTKDEQGNERPDPQLARLVTRVKDLPGIAFGGMGGNAVVVMGGGQVGGAGATIRNMHITRHRMTMRVNGAQIQVGPDDEVAEQPAREPRGPVVTVRVRAGDDGKLVMDRIMPGSTPGHTWTAMPRLRIDDAPAPGNPAPPQVHHAPHDAARAHIKARYRAIATTIKSLKKHKATIEKQLQRQDQFTPERIAAFARQREQIAEQIARLTDQLAALKQAAAQLRQPAPPPPPPPPPARKPADTDF